ncbi:MAG: phosphatase PAP2 family protein [Thiohalorhabdus sp.]|uniref:phosphatase PAP2 family protein n=1 Tax=Thiohalorhabdus sp. TaxID=3094134 RepID=UPI00397F05DB
MTTRRLDYLELTLLTTAATLWAFYYYVVGHLAQRSGIDFGESLMTPLDAAIPHTDLFLPFYLLWYLMHFITAGMVVRFYGRDLPMLRRFFGGTILLWGLAYGAFLLFPNSIEHLLHTGFEEGLRVWSGAETAFSQLVPFWNAAPSLHVAAGWFYYRAIWQHTKPEWRRWYLFWVLLMSLATVTLKYHYLVDVLVGVLCAELAFSLSIGKRDILRTEHWDRLPRRQLLTLQGGAVLVLGGGLGLSMEAGFWQFFRESP